MAITMLLLASSIQVLIIDFEVCIFLFYYFLKLLSNHHFLKCDQNEDFEKILIKTTQKIEH